MNILFLSLLYHPETAEEVLAASKDGMQNQINNYQWAYIDGLKQNLQEGERLSILNAMPVGIFPLRYRKLLLPSRNFGDAFEEIGSLNLPYFKQRRRQRKAAKAIEAWAAKNPENRHILLYTLYLPYMQAIKQAKRRYPDLKATVIVTDLPNELGISSGRKGLLKRIEYAMGRQRMDCEALDGFVMLTEPMAEALPVNGKPTLVMEGLILPGAVQETPEHPASQGPAESVTLYTGTLNKELGVAELIAAFACDSMNAYPLWLCGKGDMEEAAAQAARVHPNIQYLGFVSQQRALQLQSQAALLINPRSSEGVFTRYSFPSKTLEYMRSGKPVLCYHLEGIPADYDPYLLYIEHEGAEGIRKAVRDAMALPATQRESIGARARAYVLAEKSAAAQGVKLLHFLRRV